MAVLIEGVSVLVRVQTLADRHAGGWERFVAEVPNKTLCADAELARVGFLMPNEAHDYCLHLEQRGLTALDSAGASLDIAVVDQLHGLLADCPWLELGVVSSVECPPVRAARLKGSAEERVAIPPGWTYSGSLTQQLAHVAEQAAHQTPPLADETLAAMPVPGAGRDN